MKRVLLGILVASLFTSSAAFAQESHARPAKAAAAKAKLSDSCAEQRRLDPKKVCSLDIEGSSLDGERVTPNGEQILAHPPAMFGSLIRYRTTMVDKVLQDTARF
jgi:hypothetical protein